MRKRRAAARRGRRARGAARPGWPVRAPAARYPGLERTFGAAIGVRTRLAGRTGIERALDGLALGVIGRLLAGLRLGRGLGIVGRGRIAIRLPGIAGLGWIFAALFAARIGIGGVPAVVAAVALRIALATTALPRIRGGVAATPDARRRRFTAHRGLDRVAVGRGVGHIRLLSQGVVIGGNRFLVAARACEGIAAVVGGVRARNAGKAARRAREITLR